MDCRDNRYDKLNTCSHVHYLNFQGPKQTWSCWEIIDQNHHICLVNGVFSFPIKGIKWGKPSKTGKLMDVDNRQVSYLLRGPNHCLRTEQIHSHEEIIVDIFRRLPVRSLLRFKCILKFWKTLISQPYFTKKHQSHVMNDLNSKKFLVSQWHVGEDFMFNFYSSPLYMVPPAVEDIKKLVCPSTCKPLTCMLHCSCDGLVLLSIVKCLLLWNPSTRESIELPRSEHTKERFTYGIGYDSTSDDYKILRFNYPGIEILALKSGYWRENNQCQAGFEPLWDRPVDSFVFLHGAFHWVGSVRELFVVSFSISDEVYREIQLVEPMLETVNGLIKHGVSVLGEMLCFYYAHGPHHSRESTFKLWVMKDYGVKESWIPLYMIQDKDLYLLRPIYMFADGEVLLNYRCMDHVGFDMPFRTSKGPFGLWPGNNTLKQGIIYTESLISPKSLI